MDLFFEIVQVALGVRNNLSRKPSEGDWTKIFEVSKTQSVIGLTFYSIEKLSCEGLKPPTSMLYEWIGISEQIRLRNLSMNKNIVSLFGKLNSEGFECCLLKGQGNAVLYDSVSRKDNGGFELLALLRQPGDIDVWLRDVRRNRVDVRGTIRYVKEKKPYAKACYHHIDLGLYNGTEVEVHYRPSFMFNPIHNSRLQKWFCANTDEQFKHEAELPDGVGAISVPSTEFNIIFQLSHIYNHLLHEGIGMRQIIDYFYVLKSNTNRTNDTNICDTLRNLGLEKIAGAVMWVLHEKLGLPEERLIAPMDERRGKILLEEVMRGGNFGHYDTENAKATSRLKKNVQRIKRDLRMMRYFPSECLWEPVFRVYHWMWRVRYN